MVSCPMSLDGAAGRLPPVPRAALERAGAHQGRDPLRPRGLAGGVRRARRLDDVEVRAATTLPYGGAKGGVRCSPREMSRPELERLTRRFTSELLPFIGPQEDIPAPDMATNEQTMAWMMDTYSMQRGHAVPEIVTGKPISIGGSVFRHEATGAGVVMVTGRACERLGWRLGAALRRAGLRQRRRDRR